MVNKFIRYSKGYVRIKIVSSEPERFFNLCAHNQLELWNMVHEEFCYYFDIKIKDFFQLKKFNLKTDTKIKILERHGLPFFFQKSKKRKAFFLGFLIFASMIYMLSLYVWNIHIDGNSYYSTQRILEYLDTEEVRHGIFKHNLDCSQIAAKLRQAFPKITWVSAKIEGTQLVLEIKENDDLPEETEAETSTEDLSEPCDIVASKDGKVVKIITRSGKPLVAADSECKKGDVLVSGEIEIMNDSLEVERRDYVHSDADIYMETAYSYYDEFPLNYQERVYTGEKKTSRFLKLFQFYIDFGRKKHPYEYYDQYSQASDLYLTENFILPISYGTMTTLPYTIEDKTYTEEEAAEKADANLYRFLKNLSEKGVEIHRKNVKIDTTADSCVVTGKVYVIEKTGTNVPVTVTEPEPEETESMDETMTPEESDEAAEERTPD